MVAATASTTPKTAPARTLTATSVPADGGGVPRRISPKTMTVQLGIPVLRRAGSNVILQIHRRPKLFASAIASVREVTPIFRKMFPTWNLTVFSLMLRAPAMDLFR